MGDKDDANFLAAFHNRSCYVKGFNAELFVQIYVADIGTPDTIVISRTPPLLTAIVVMTGLFCCAHYSPLLIRDQSDVVDALLTACGKIFEVIGSPVI